MRTYSNINPSTLNLNEGSPFIMTHARAGHLVTMRNDITVGENIRTLGHWAWDHVEIFQALMADKGTFVDLGAYIGHHSVIST